MYVGLLYFRTLGLCLAGMAGLFYISTFIDLSDNLFKGTATTGMLLQYFWFATPQYLYYIIALAVLLAAIVTIGTLTKSSELVVMRACGISLYRTAVPLLVAAAVASAALFAIEESILGPANRHANELVRRIRGQPPRSFDVLDRAWLTGGDGTVYHYQAYSPSDRELSGLTVLTFTDAESVSIARRTFARVATAGPDADTSRAWQARGGLDAHVRRTISRCASSRASTSSCSRSTRRTRSSPRRRRRRR